jgi:hypothetical protein
MSNLLVAVLSPPDYAKDLGKKGATIDITFYNLKKGDATVTFIEPTRYPEKLSSLFYAVSAGGFVINMGILYLLTSVGGVYYLLSNIIGILVGFGWNFMVNRRMTCTRN